ncbi:hypothetical protein KEJ23_04045 [Candidatus Bathyarchaeota archaeon]|nr:hypothetical protein [Candidatus Bathyarchaeota archaeon]
MPDRSSSHRLQVCRTIIDFMPPPPRSLSGSPIEASNITSIDVEVALESAKYYMKLSDEAGKAEVSKPL